MSASDDLLDGQIGHIVDLKRYSETVVFKIIASLNRADKALFAELIQKLETMDAASFSVDRLDSMLASVRQINSAAFAQVTRELTDDLRDFVAYEAAFQHSLLASALPVQISLASVAVEAVHAGAMARPFQGGLLKEFFKDIEAKKAAIIRRSIADGFVQGKTTAAIVREIIGTKAKGYADSVIDITRRDAQAVVRTALSHTAAYARQATFDANADIIKGYGWVSALDLRTSSPCRARDGKRYDKAFKPVGHTFPWGAGPGNFHWNCRSVSTPILKSLKEITGLDIEDFTPAERASMDGQIPASTDYGSWLKKQSAARQDDVLGPSRGALLRQGNLSLDEMYSAKGKPLTLNELRERHAKAFSKAGM